jgi:hypothetical protein
MPIFYDDEKGNWFARDLTLSETDKLLELGKDELVRQMGASVIRKLSMVTKDEFMGEQEQQAIN